MFVHLFYTNNYRLAARVVSQNCLLVTIRAGSKGYDSKLPASYHWGTAMIDRAGREEATEGLERMWLNRHFKTLILFILLTLTFYHSAAWGSEALVCFGTRCT